MKSSSKAKIDKPPGPSKPEEPKTDVAASTTKAVSISLDTNLLFIAKHTDFSYILKEVGNRLLVAEFFAQWCGPCKTLSTKLEKLANAYNGKILIVKIDVDEFEELTLEYNISAIPTFLLMKNQKKLEQFSSSNVQTLETSLEKHAGKPELNELSEEEKKERVSKKIVRQSAQENKEKK